MNISKEMGNVQSATIANQLLPFEAYIAEVPELKSVARLEFLAYKNILH